jgi:hypothetical protein
MQQHRNPSLVQRPMIKHHQTPSIEQGATIFLVMVFERGKENHFSHGESLF